MRFKKLEVTDQNGHKTEFLKDIDTGKLYKRTGLVPRDFPGCQIVEETVEQADTWSIKEVADTLEKHGLIREQEPCEDCISRQALYEWLDGWKEKNKYYHPHTKNEIIPICEVIDIIQSLPSVTPQPKIAFGSDRNSDLTKNFPVTYVKKSGTTHAANGIPTQAISSVLVPNDVSAAEYPE
jgi:hypothetical protein